MSHEQPVSRQKTNAIRFLESKAVDFDILEYEVDEDVSAVHVAEKLNMDPDQIFKTIVLKGERTGYFVCIIPGSCEIDLRKAAKAIGDKSCDLIPLKDLEPLTGYIRGACSPFGMKKKFPTFLDETASMFDRISVSAGKRGMQIFIAPGALAQLAEADMVDLIQ
ncbi:MAG: Cys-tRNA(Pro) deacylase [Spirochaetia bacterium]|nr:Cys-tRNA(Pro) deacylase [Spirochaetia bacterium]